MQSKERLHARQNREDPQENFTQLNKLIEHKGKVCQEDHPSNLRSSNKRAKKKIVSLLL